MIRQSLPSRPRGLRRLLRRLRRDRSGATAVEVAILALPFFLVICAILETAMIFLAGEVLDSAVADANRFILTGQAQAADFDLADYRERVCQHTFGLFDCDAIHIRVGTVNGFAAAPTPPTAPAMTGCETGCRWNESETFLPGQGSNVVLVRAYYRWPTLLDVGLGMGNLPDGSRLLGSVHVFRNEPFS